MDLREHSPSFCTLSLIIALEGVATESPSAASAVRRLQRSSSTSRLPPTVTDGSACHRSIADDDLRGLLARAVQCPSECVPGLSLFKEFVSVAEERTWLWSLDDGWLKPDDDVALLARRTQHFDDGAPVHKTKPRWVSERELDASQEQVVWFVHVLRIWSIPIAVLVLAVVSSRSRRG